jgi:Tfp pilus assembly protein PilF
MRWLAYAYQNFAPDFDKSVYWYRRCVDFDPPRADCPTFLSKLYRSNGHIDKAWESVVGALQSPMQERTFSNNFYIYHCSLHWSPR